jgi:hypothetical protein
MTFRAVSIFDVFFFLRSISFLLNKAVTATLSTLGLAIEFLTYGIHKFNVEFLRDGFVVSGKSFGCRVLYSKFFGYLCHDKGTSLRSPFSWITFRKKINFAFKGILAYLLLFLRDFLTLRLPETFSFAIVP